MKTDAECAEILLKFVKQNAEECYSQMLKVQCDIQATQVAHDMWEKANAEDGLGAFSSNPYKVRAWDKENEEKLRKAKETWDDVYNFTLHRVCQNIPNKEENG